MKNEIIEIFISCLHREHYSLSIKRRSNTHFYSVSANSFIFDFISSIVNNNKNIVCKIELSIYPTILITRK